MTGQNELVYALQEEIGDPSLFTGRRKDLDYFLEWVEGVKARRNISVALFARRKKGKTALVQRLYNILFSANDPMVVPFYYKSPEEEKSQLKLSDEFYRSFLRQYAAFMTRDTSYMIKPVTYRSLCEIFKHDRDIVDDIEYMEYCLKEQDPDKAWNHAAYAGERISILKNIRIIQILDEFQYLNEYIYKFDDFKTKIHLCGTYHYVGASKISPVIVTGSYVSWLMSILSSMTGRYQSRLLKDLPQNEALEAVYRYSEVYGMPVNRDTAAYIAELAGGDAYYISRMFASDCPDKNLTDMDSIDRVVLYETRTRDKEIGEIAKMWFEYLYDAIGKVNDRNGKRIILYLAKQGEREKTRKEIMDDLNLEMSDSELEKKLDTLINADILSYGQTRFRYKGLGDKMFEIVFRGMYQDEIENMEAGAVDAGILSELKTLKGKVNYYKGIMAEYAVINRILFAYMNKTSLQELVDHYIEGYELCEFLSGVKKRFSLNQTEYIEVDIQLESKGTGCNDLILEVKNREDDVKSEDIRRFIENKKRLMPVLERKTGFIFYSYRELPEKYQEMLKAEGIMLMHGE